MPLNATCTNCGKSYQAPDSMAGKSVRCKSCGTVFRVMPPDMEAPEPGDLDFDELERSFSGEALETATGKVVVDPKGKVSIKRSADVADVKLAGEGNAAALRSNFRYRFPMAKQIDQFLPWILLVGCMALLWSWCRSVNDAGHLEAPETSVAVSRFFLLVGVYVLLVFPAAHIAMHKASRALRFSMPRAAAWRSFTGFMPLLLLGAGLYMVSGGALFGLILGILLGTLVSVGAVALLYRLFPNEMPMVAAYSAGGAILAGTFAAALLFAINLVALSFANMSKKEPTLFVSPIALGLRWQDKPAVVAVKPKPTRPADPVPSAATQATTTPAGPMLTTAAVPANATVVNERKMVRKVELTPVTPGFGKIVAPPIESRIVAALRDSAGGAIDVYNTEKWTRTAGAQNFRLTDGLIAPNTDGDVAVRIANVPSYRLEGLGLVRDRIPETIDFETGDQRSILGFVNSRTLLVIVHNGSRISLERYDVARAIRRGSPVPFGSDDPLNVAWVPGCVRMTPDGKYLLVAGRPADETVGRLALYDATNPSRLISRRDLPLNPRFDFRPAGLAITNAGKVAMLLNTDNEAYLTLWQMDLPAEGETSAATGGRRLLERKLGLMSAMQPRFWEQWSTYDALIWVNDQTLLMFGNYIVDATSGAILGETGYTNIVGQLRESENVALLINNENGVNQLLRVSFDPTVIDEARPR